MYVYGIEIFQMLPSWLEMTLPFFSGASDRPVPVFPYACLCIHGLMPSRSRVVALFPFLSFSFSPSFLSLPFLPFPSSPPLFFSFLFWLWC